MCSMYKRVVVPGLIVLAGVSGVACDRLLGDRIEVSMRTSAGLQSGDGVYIAGVRIGSIGTPEVREGRAIVPVYVRDIGALPKDGLVFLLADQGRGRMLSVIAARGAYPHSTPPLYQGAASDLELAGLVGVGEARRLMLGLAEWAPH